MRAYAQSTGLVAAVSQAPPDETAFSRQQVHDAVVITMRRFFPSLSEDEIESFICTQWERCESLEDVDALESTLREKAKEGTTDEKILLVMEGIRERSVQPSNGLLVRYVVAGIIGVQAGEQERQEYLFELWTGRAF